MYESAPNWGFATCEAISTRQPSITPNICIFRHAPFPTVVSSTPNHGLPLPSNHGHPLPSSRSGAGSVSYTHLDVYKRQHGITLSRNPLGHHLKLGTAHRLKWPNRTRPQGCIRPPYGAAHCVIERYCCRGTLDLYQNLSLNT